MTTTVLIKENEYIPALRALACIAQAEGVLSKAERSALRAALQDTYAPPSRSLDEMVFDAHDLDEYLRDVQSPQAREMLYHSACLILRREGEDIPGAESLLARLRQELRMDELEPTLTKKAKEKAEAFVDEARKTIFLNQIDMVQDKILRTEKANAIVLKYGALNAAIGAIPVPASDLILSTGTIALQAKMFHDVGRLYGAQDSDEQVKEIMAGIGAGTTVRVAMVAFMKLIPLWGSIVGAITGFITTYALGKVAEEYYERGQKADLETLRKVFLDAQEEGKEIYKKNKHNLDTRVREMKAWLRSFWSERDE